MKIDYKKQGRANLRRGREHEKKVREYWEKEGWVVSKWQNNVDLKNNKLIPAKQGKFRKVSTGFPDFLIFRPDQIEIHLSGNKQYGIEPRIELRNRLINGEQFYRIIGVEAKSGKYLDKEEKAKAKWLLENNVFNRIVISSRGKKGEVVNREFKD